MLPYSLDNNVNLPVGEHPPGALRKPGHLSSRNTGGGYTSQNGIIGDGKVGYVG
jgi:hypothetical protein